MTHVREQATNERNRRLVREPAGDKSHDHSENGGVSVSSTCGPADVSIQVRADIVDIYSGRLHQLSDPEFMTRWAALRLSLFYIAKDQPEYADTKRQYAAAATEFRRRMNGGLAEDSPDY
jgi:hypothetical protein